MDKFNTAPPVVGDIVTGLMQMTMRLLEQAPTHPNPELLREAYQVACAVINVSCKYMRHELEGMCQECAPTDIALANIRGASDGVTDAHEKLAVIQSALDQAMRFTGNLAEAGHA